MKNIDYHFLSLLLRHHQLQLLSQLPILDHLERRLLLLVVHPNVCSTVHQKQCHVSTVFIARQMQSSVPLAVLYVQLSPAGLDQCANRHVVATGRRSVQRCRAELVLDVDARGIGGDEKLDDLDEQDELSINFPSLLTSI